MKNLLLILIVFLLAILKAEALTLTQMPLNEQVEKADIIAQVRVVETKESETGSVKYLVVEVRKAILNSKVGDRLNLLGRNGVIGSDIQFDCLGREAIVIMEKANPKYAPDNFYESVNQKLSVYHIEKGKVLGLTNKSIEVEEAIRILKDRLAKI